MDKQLLSGIIIVVKPSRGKGKSKVKQVFSSRKAGAYERLLNQNILIATIKSERKVMAAPEYAVYIYIIQSSTGEYYTGISKDIESRLVQHNGGQCKSTRKLDGWMVIHLEIKETRKEARKLEVQIKNRGAKRYIYSFSQKYKK